MSVASDTRKHTKFELCARHAHWRRDGRSRLAEFFCEGGDGNHCEGGLCRCHPGTDLFTAEICTFGEMSYNWDRWPGESEGRPWMPFDSRTAFNAESFDVSAVPNLTLALEVIQAAANQEVPDSLPHIRLEGAAATIRELLSPTSHYFTSL